MTACRRPLAWLLLVALLFAQMANAAYACPNQASGGAYGSVVPSQAAASSGTLADCAQMIAAATDHHSTSPPLCAEHFTHATQATADVHAPVLHWVAAPQYGVVLDLRPIDPASDAMALSQPPGTARSTAPLIAILLGRFLS